MDIKSKKSKKILIVLFIICIFIAFKLKSEDVKLYNNIKKLEQNLENRFNGEHTTCKDLFDFDYDKVYVFQPYLPKKEIEKEIGFKYWKLKETVNECMMNILFVKDNNPVAYLYGYAENLGYYIDIHIGEYNKSDLDKAKYSVKEIEIGNSYGVEKTYKEYIINI